MMPGMNRTEGSAAHAPKPLAPGLFHSMGWGGCLPGGQG